MQEAFGLWWLVGHCPERPRQTQAVGTGEAHKVKQSQAQGVASGLWQLPLPVQAGKKGQRIALLKKG